MAHGGSGSYAGWASGVSPPAAAGTGKGHKIVDSAAPYPSFGTTALLAKVLGTTGSFTDTLTYPLTF